MNFYKVLNTQVLRSLFVIIALLSINTEARSQSYTVIGCVSDDTGYLYTGPSGVYSPRYGGYGPAYETTPVVTSGQVGTGIYCAPVVLGNCVIRTKTKCSECTGPYDYQSGYGTNYYYEQAGKLKGFMNCPIDDYIGLMVVAIGGIGFVLIRKNF
ncbi:MAG: hypothetical protein EOO07_04110 [Chitinophagaceae bacterium]|nr:MAG: hypothetical protein EOO07_04110 [Chitinophagaceae bacterium]